MKPGKDSAIFLDDKNRRIVEFLVRRPHASIASIGREFGYPPSTVQKRLSRMFREGLIERSVRVVDWSVLGFPLRYWIDLRVNVRELQAGRGGLVTDRARIDSSKKLATYIMNTLALAPEYKDQLIVQDVAMLLGSPADMSITLRARDHRVVLSFVTDGLRRLGGVDATTTYHEAWSCLEGEP